ncbi:MAG TPA: hypothetical protein VFM71_13970 [Gemmatimonadaceae bacterium]|nr:hypothetical protein [Gemmatimonadaceae bacterium]
MPSFEQPGKYLAAQHADLKAAVIEPFELQLRPDAAARKSGPWEDRPYRMFVVARASGQALFVSAESGRFSLGQISAAGEPSIVGFESTDALAEWVS